MNKKDLAYLKKGFKLESPLITIDNLVTVYMKKETGDIIVSQQPTYPVLNQDIQELYLKNVKKLMSGKLLSNIFDLNFKDDSEEIVNNLTNIYRGEDFENNCNVLIGRIAESYNFDTDVVINITRFTLNEEENTYNFMACTVNKIKSQKREFICDLTTQEFDTFYEQNPMINITSPCDGFIFPSIEEKVPNVSNILYYSSKKNSINDDFVDVVMGALSVLTASEEKELFDEILRDIFGESIPKNTLQNIYERLNTFKESSCLISTRSLKSLLISIIPDKENDINDTFTNRFDGSYDFTVDNLIPDFSSKSLCVLNKDLDLVITPSNLEELDFMEEDGMRYLKIPIKETLILNGFNLVE